MEYGLIGEHLGHSYSKEIHAQLAGYTYELKEIAPEDLDGFMRAKDFKAINVTIPYKQDVIPYLDEISERAVSIGAVNTIVNKDGRLVGDNTDFAGMAMLIGHLGLNLEGKKVLILGTGGTSKTAYAVAKSMKAGEILKVSRSPQEGTVTYEEARTLHDDAEIIINTTPSGMYPNVCGAAVDIDCFPALEGVIDVVYNPLRTDIVLNAQERGLPAQGGLYMLAGQGVYACGDFLDKEMSEEDVNRAYKSVLDGKRNIVLTGMPSCGKTTIGSALAEKLGRRLIDTDDLVIRKINTEIADYFASHGESAFRDRESEAIEEISLETGLIIATGGGAVLRERNVRALKRNGLVLFLDRPFEKLLATDDRPLSSSAEDLKKRYDERIDIYRSTADAVIDASGDIESVVAAVTAAVDRYF